MYNIRITKDRENLLKEAAKEDDNCDVDAVCDSIPDMLEYVRYIEEKNKNQKSTIQRLEAEKKELERKINNVKSQKFRQIKKKGK